MQIIVFGGDKVNKYDEKEPTKFLTNRIYKSSYLNIEIKIYNNIILIYIKKNNINHN